jgi:anti-sigma B factor antagonist
MFHDFSQAYVTTCPVAGGECAVVTVFGDVDLCTAPRFVDLLLSAVRAGPAVVMVDLTGVEFFGSQALRAMLSVRDVAALWDVRLIVVCGGIVDRVLEVTCTRDMFDCYASVEEARRGRTTG